MIAQLADDAATVDLAPPLRWARGDCMIRRRSSSGSAAGESPIVIRVVHLTVAIGGDVDYGVRLSSDGPRRRR